ncbi:NADH-quinone oxidoreductase subunit L [Desulfocurvibacter africanus]|uniref:NADH dehydrogenase (Quinone) n=1 Tax=Desulfocurvibacter africanus subsp. africanus str. Walvis Bay TaxID=690850 RepID=F3YUI4_DESAF|nr:proton-conducting transporter membrane subunit [Desulfocurvibacter africanus]EGJ48938.1 NADH dehydrogenase (quinone) [Desulfocurvibacter africanus subsp. africanus str. Walvis Bay]
MLPALLFICIVVPILAAGACFVVRAQAVRSATVLATGALLMAGSVLLAAQGAFSFDPGTLGGLGWGTLISVLDFLLLAVILFYGFRLKSRLVQILALLQIAPLAWFELFALDHGAAVLPLHGDGLSLLMVLVISIVGSLICIFAIPYMKKHEEHLHLAKSRQPRFFFFLVLFLGAMNGLVLANNLLWLYFFFEVTTLCSFMLIGHDRTEEAVRNATRALWMNSLGGVAFVFGMILLYSRTGTLDLQALLMAGPLAGAVLLPVALICLAGFTKAAQVPFQSWLLGAMVAPTPVSALLHSSTMVKAGVYLVLRLSPLYAGSFLGTSIALFGGFSFLATAALALGQSNGKKILAYSTIGNLGLIIACAGLGTPAAMSAAILLILFHAVSKGLLFLCVGTIEQGIGSRDIEDMRGLYKVMPRTAIITVLGVATMLLPPFGVLLSKWLAIEAAAHNAPLVVMLALASALSVVYWGRWAGMLMSAPFSREVKPEPLSALTLRPLQILVGGAIVLALFIPWIYESFALPMLGESVFSVHYGVLTTGAGAFAVYPLFFAVLVGALFAWWAARKSRFVPATSLYMGGANATGSLEEPAFVGPMNKPVKVAFGNYYLESLFGEGKLTRWVNIAALALLLLVMGGAL